MSKKYVYTFKIPIIYTNLPPQYYKGFLPNDTLQVKMKTTGYQILKLKLLPKKLKLDIQKFNLLNRQSWDPESIKGLIEKMFDYQGNLIDITPKSVHFSIKAVQKKHVPVQADVHLQYAPGYKNKTAPVLKPDSIWVYGDKQILDTLKFIKTRHFDITNIKKNVNKSLMLIKIKGLKYNKNKIWLKVPVSEIVEENMSLPIKIAGLPKNLTILLFPEKIKLNFKFFKDDYKNVNPEDFKVQVHFDPKQTQWLPKLTQKPRGTFDFVIKPKKITYLIKEK